MDCPTEEQMIRMHLAELGNIHTLEFDLPGRRLIVYHTGPYEPVLRRLDALQLDTSLVESVAEADLQGSEASAVLERKLLWQVLLINLFFFVLELSTGFFSRSMGLVADSLDMLADSIVYGLALMAVGTTLHRKIEVARWAGFFQLVLAVLGFMEVVRRFIHFDHVPLYGLMIVISLMALVGNTVCLYLLQRSKTREAHMQASMIFTSNDIIANLGVIVAGVLVYLTHSRYPDLIIGTLVFILVGRGAFRILSLAR